ncbi:MAG TPA: carboxypeptidase-like regulatory domain-containing protein [Terriglobales bacterium]|nr:carboxypeptidase-like regulatory domain-containing protein [Terriglobales bacterium]
MADSKKDPRKDYALIIGTVFDSSGHLVPGVPVKIRRADQKKAKWELISNSMGEFAQRLPTGQADYIVWADIKLPKGEPRPETKVHIESNERVDISLHLK